MKFRGTSEGAASEIKMFTVVNVATKKREKELHTAFLKDRTKGWMEGYLLRWMNGCL